MNTTKRDQNYAIGFADELSQFLTESLIVAGKVPDWLNGTLIKNGPAKFHAGQIELAHWFDGFAKLHKFDIASGQIQYSCRFIESQAYHNACVNGKLGQYEFASNPEFGLFDRLKAIVSPPLTDNTNVNLIPGEDRWLALTETSKVIGFSPETLDTLGPFNFKDKITAQFSTAHPVLDPNTGAILNLHIEISLGVHYLISYWQQEGSASKRKILARIPVKQPAYMHSFAQTARYLIIVESPLRLRSLDLVLGKKPYLDCYEWHEGMGTRFLVIDKSDGSYFVCDYADRFYFHQVNGFEVDNVLVLDVLTYPDATVLNEFRLINLKAGRAIQIPRLERFHIDLKTKKVEANHIGSCAIELARINHLRTNCIPHRYVWGAGATSNISFLDQVVKLDVQSGSHSTWARPGCYYGEPLFVARPDGQLEDDGVLLCIELDSIKQCSKLVIIDATSMQLLAEATTPNIVPFGFHAVFAPRRIN
jgi:carotenoid cleavage dioxygenase-like enzyme